MSIYLDKLANVQVVINCQYSVEQICTREDARAHNSGAPYFEDVMSYNSLTTYWKKSDQSHDLKDGNTRPVVKHFKQKWPFHNYLLVSQL